MKKIIKQTTGNISCKKIQLETIPIHQLCMKTQSLLIPHRPQSDRGKDWVYQELFQEI